LDECNGSGWCCHGVELWTCSSVVQDIHACSHSVLCWNWNSHLLVVKSKKLNVGDKFKKNVFTV